MILIIELMHTNQLLGSYSFSHNLFVCPVRLGSGLQLSIRMCHGFTPAFVDITAEGLDLRIRAAIFLNHFVNCIRLTGLETSRSLRNSVAYIQNWLTVLKNDKRFIVSASGKAEKAVNLILGSAE